MSLATSLSPNCSGTDTVVATTPVGYKKTGAMHEKYNVQKCGEFGGGGFYKPQTGFGWSNGVVLTFLEEFGWPEDLGIGC